MRYLLVLLLLAACVKTIEKPVYVPKEVKVVVSVPCVERDRLPTVCPVPANLDSNTAELVRQILLENQCLLENDARFRALLTNCTGE